MMAARAGASKVVACEWHGALATCARRNVALNGLSKTVTVASGDVAKLRRGKQGVPVDGFDVAVVDLFDAGLTGDHVLWMLEQARKHVLAPGAVVVPAAATMYCVGLEAYTAEVNGFDFAAFNKYRWDSTYRAARLADEEHRVLTKPKRVFEFFLQERDENGDTDGRFVGGASNRETVARLETVASGYLNAVAFWFDLHMDERETITTAPPGYGKGGTVLFEETRFRNDPGGLRAAREARDEDAKREMEAAAARHAATLAANPRTHLGAEAFSRKDDVRVDDDDERAEESSEEKTKEAPRRSTDPERETYTHAGSVAEDGECTRAVVPACAPPTNDDGKETEGGSPARRSAAGSAGERREHYWGQAVQYLERGVQVRANKKVTLLARREADRVRFSLKEGVGAFVGKPPWKIEWGGGASVESPHFQRVHYCELLVGDYLMRLKSRRFPPIEKEMKMILAHCGNLFLDPEVIAEITHWFACLELVHGQQDFSPGASIEAMSKTPLRLG